jgi:hypothetical protein
MCHPEIGTSLAPSRGKSASQEKIMSITRLSTTALILGTVIIAMAYTNPLSAKGKDCEMGDTRPKCTGDSGSGGSEEVATYSFLLMGSVNGGSGDDVWDEHAKGIHLNRPQAQVKTNIDLSYFDARCFGNGTYEPTGGRIVAGKQGSTEAWLWFLAETTEGVTAQYLLIMFGSFADPNPTWLPAGDVTTTSMIMTSWEMQLGNGHPELESTACVGENDVGFNVAIDVNLNPTQ